MVCFAIRLLEFQSIVEILCPFVLSDFDGVGNHLKTELCYICMQGLCDYKNKLPARIN